MTEIILKKLYGEDKQAKVGKILIKPGDLIKAGDGLFNAESTKGNFLVKSEYSGEVTAVLIEEGQTIKIGNAIAKLEGAQKSAADKKSGSGYSFGLAKPKKEDIQCDIAIIGGGPGGYVAAIRAAQLGANVVLIEADKIGGTCLNTGCIPTKSFVKSAHLFDEMKRSADFGIHASDLAIDLAAIVNRKNSVVSNLVGGIDYLLTKWQVKVIRGKAVIEKDSVITVKNDKVDAVIKSDKIIIATGSSPAKLPIPGSDLPVVMTNEEILAMTDCPQSLTIVGGGVIGMEFAFIFNAFGCDVTIVEFLDNILCNCDEDVIDIILDACEARGIKCYTSACVEAIDGEEGGKAVVTFKKDDQKHFVVSDKVLMAVGRRPNLNAIDLSVLNVSLNQRGNGVLVDEHMATSNPNVYAIGDVANIIQLAHVASHQGIVAAENCMGKDSKMSYDAVPSAIFVSPEIATVGMSEKKAKETGLAYGVSKFPFSANGKALSQGETEGFVKLIYSEDEKCILGAAVIGPGATDLIAGLTYHIENKTDYRKLQHTIYAHPTTAESVHEAILGITGEAIHFA
ncbi:dihydrolipoyl dehydrogenase [Fusibacter paucivorans]|uniref:Dihydrolipoyl dehydrogenase n=1 Tax=Fusibacter paucivorans TaxID=76009 RepID=A0ABS5PR70_9FIRM|nr:dihydrolipoyl dehydrogenase [Fusibacter paucivorans]MBS7526909.1 dihydrolipoyl dehydrogenase [Fusibacter paucivorans]